MQAMKAEGGSSRADRKSSHSAAFHDHYNKTGRIRTSKELHESRDTVKKYKAKLKAARRNASFPNASIAHNLQRRG